MTVYHNILSIYTAVVGGKSFHVCVAKTIKPALESVYLHLPKKSLIYYPFFFFFQMVILFTLSVFPTIIRLGILRFWWAAESNHFRISQEVEYTSTAV